MDVTGSSAS